MGIYHPGRGFTRGSYEYGAMHDGREHAGIDFLADEGTEIPVAATGTVVGLGFDPTYGNTAIVRHSGPTEPPYRYTLYAHMGADSPVTAGLVVLKGATIGTVNSTGTGGNGVPHLHFELIHLHEQTWEDLWHSYSRYVEYWRDDVPLMLDNPEGRVNPLDPLNWLGLDVYSRRGSGGGGRGLRSAIPF